MNPCMVKAAMPFFLMVLRTRPMMQTPQISLQRLIFLLARIGIAGGFLLISVNLQACNTNAWSQAVSVTATESARYDGACGLRADASVAGPHYVVDNTPGTLPEAITQYVVRMYVYIGDLSLSDSDNIVIFRAQNAGNGELFGLRLHQLGMQQYFQLYAFEDDGSQVVSINNVLVNQGWRAVELTWAAASSVGANDGSLHLSIDSQASGDSINYLDNDMAEVATVSMGIVSGNTGSVSGFLDFDSFASQKNGSHGTILKDCNVANVVNKTFTPGVENCALTGGLNFGSRVVFDNGADSTITASSITLSAGVVISQGANVIMQTQ